MGKKINLLRELEKKERKAHLIDDINSMIPVDTIGLKLDSLESLFNPLDPSPLEKRNLCPELESYLLDCIESLNATSRLKIEISAPESVEEETVKNTLKKHFERKAKTQLKQNHKNSRKWRINLISGLVFLGLCLLAAHVFALPKFEQYTFAKVLSESFGIIGWVAIWEPAEYFLFKWKEDAQSLQKLMKLHSATVCFSK